MKGPILTSGQESRMCFADIAEFNEADARKGLTQLKEASSALEKSDDLTGVVEGLMPKALKDIVNPKPQAYKKR